MADQTDMKFHTATYDSVMGFMKWGTVAVAIIAAVVIWLIA